MTALRTMSFVAPAEDESGVVTARVARQFGLPDFVKSATPADAYGDGLDLPPSAYADPATRRLALHTKAATWLSAAFLVDQRDRVPPARLSELAGRVADAAVFHRMSTLPRVTAEKAAADEAGDGLPLRNATEVKAAAEWVARHATTMTPAECRETAAAVLAKAAALDVPDAAAIVAPHAGETYGPATPLADAFRARARLVGARDRDFAAQLTKMAAAVESSPGDYHHGDARAAAVHCLRATDAAIGIGADDYGDHLVSPDRLAGAGVEKVAEYRAAFAPGPFGEAYLRDDLARVPWEAVTAAVPSLASQFVPSVEKLASVLAAGGEEAVVAADVVRRAGVTPVYDAKPQRPDWETIARG